MNDLVQWLRAQLGEDAGRATQWHDLECEIHVHQDGGLHAAVVTARMLTQVSGAVCDCGGPACVLREIDAKRQLIEKAADADRYSRTAWANAGSVGAASAYRTMLRLLALPYADRPGYRDDWRP